ncbi:hypothetical protein G7Y89_g9068 [Cudoniella acicularis]|uniref:AMP-dependent synthetase/ligase domain-containing protein n=1 Tax=Cudoniella acicularis TaxID=354080 RepID=A0A8H4W0H0_9HELO|nr:hypothetical protein G7Y89_g9068 [Cudoniella acicularis]
MAPIEEKILTPSDFQHHLEYGVVFLFAVPSHPRGPSKKDPENVVLECHTDRPITYRELNERSNRLARYLAHAYPKSQKVVALCLEKGHVLVISVLAIMKAGMAWVPIPMDAPAARISNILEACDAKLALCSNATQHILANLVPCLKPDEIFDTAQF